MPSYTGESGYLKLLGDCVYDGQRVIGRNNNATRSHFGRQLHFDLSNDKFPLLTTKKVFLKGIIVELLWFLRGGTNIAYLHDHGVTIWDEWAGKDGDLGPVYGHQWRNWGFSFSPTGKPRAGIDQIGKVIEGLKKDPHGRRHIVSAWNVAEIDEMALPPCHCLFQFYVGPNGLECQLYQRSADMFLGVPFNIASYALLTKMIGQVVGIPAAKLIITFGDCHVYEDHIPQAMIQLDRSVLAAPKMILNPIVTDIDDFTLGDFKLEHYVAHPAIKAEVHK